MCVYCTVQYSTVYSGWLCDGEAGTRASAGATVPQRPRQRKQTVTIRHRDQPDADTDTEDTVHTFLLHTYHCAQHSVHLLSASGGCAAAPSTSICSVHCQYGAQEED